MSFEKFNKKQNMPEMEKKEELETDLLLIAERYGIPDATVLWIASDFQKSEAIRSHLHNLLQEHGWSAYAWLLEISKEIIEKHEGDLSSIEETFGKIPEGTPPMDAFKSVAQK